jgi:hypothetical protein
VYRADVSEAMAKLERLNIRSAELDEEQKDARVAIAECERIIQIQNSSTREEVFRLKGTSWFSYLLPSATPSYPFQTNSRGYKISTSGKRPRSAPGWPSSSMLGGFLC